MDFIKEKFGFDCEPYELEKTTMNPCLNRRDGSHQPTGELAGTLIVNSRYQPMLLNNDFDRHLPSSSSSSTENIIEDSHSKKSANPPHFKHFVCDWVKCGKQFTRTKHLSRHKKSHTEETRFTCTYCQSKFSTKDHHEMHLRVHTDQKPFKCGICKKAFSTSKGRSMHESVHTNTKSCQCKSCKKPFKTLSTKTQTGNKDFGFCLCDQKFGRKDDGLKTAKHIEKNYGCYICEIKFGTEENLKEHENTHTGENSFNNCDFCGQPSYKCQH